MKRISFYVDGKPQPNPKTKRGRTWGGKRGVFKRDLDGRKKAWAAQVTIAACTAGLGPHGIWFDSACRLGVEVRLRQAQSNKKKYPTQAPDWSNCWYYIENILRGVAYPDDCYVIGALPGDKLWATAERPEGAYITIEEVE